MKTILVIEDEEPLRENLVQMLEFEGFHALEARNGREGVQVAQAHRPDLVICDVAMPEMDGYQVLGTLRELPETAMIPVVFLTARAGKEAVKRGIESGAAEYITKPFTFSVLMQVIRTHLDQ